MIEFNPDGSLKLPSNISKQKQENEQKMQNQRCIKVKKEVVNFNSPKKCVLHFVLSKAINDRRFIEVIHDEFSDNSSVPSRIIKLADGNFDVEIGTDFKRCTDCTNLLNRYKEFLDGNLIEEKGSCTFEGFKNFCQEDYFE